MALNRRHDQVPLLVVINVMYEMWAPGTAPGIGPMGNPLPGGALDYQARSWSDYGARSGIDRLLRLLAQTGVHASVYASGILGEQHPDSIAAIVASGHELCAHAWSQDVSFPHLSEEAERDDIARSTAALSAAGGTRPLGWMSPRCTPSVRTPALLAEAGYTWFGDVFDAELPYLVETSAGPIAALPFGLDVNDLPMFVRYGAPARELHDRFMYLLGALRSEGEPAYLDVTVHAHLAARPAGARALREIIDEVKGVSDCAFATRREVLERFLGERLTSGTA